MSTVIKFENVSFAFKTGEVVLKNLSFQVDAGKFYYLTGKSGSGKSTLIKLIAGIYRQYEGTIRIFGRDSQCLSDADLSLIRQEIGIIFQDFNLFDHLTLVQNVAIPLRIKGYSWKESLGNAYEAIQCVGLAARKDYFPKEVSGGEQQRTVIARAMISRPKILLSDEATGNLDDENAQRLLHLLLHLNKGGMTIVFATHNRHLIQNRPYEEFHLNEGHLNLINPHDFKTEESYVSHAS